MLEEEEGEQDLAREQLQGVILVLGMVPVDDVVAGRGGSVYRHSPRAHQLAFSPRCDVQPRSPRAPLLHHLAPTTHRPGVWLLSRVARSPRTAATCGLHPGRQHRRACERADGRPRCEVERASWVELDIRVCSHDLAQAIFCNMDCMQRWC